MKGGLEIFLSLESKICVEKLKDLERMKELLQLKYRKTEVGSFEIGGKRQLELFISNKVSSIMMMLMIPTIKIIIKTM